MAPKSKKTSKAKKSEALVPTEDTQEMTVFGGAPSWLVDEARNSQAGLEDADREDMMVPRAALLQAKSPLVEEPGSDYTSGQIVDSISNVVYAEPGQKLRAVIVKMTKTRGMFESDSLDANVVCRSRNSVIAEPDGEGKYKGEDMNGEATGTCSDCVFAQFGTKEDGKTAKPKCTKHYNFIAILPDFNNVVISFSMKRTMVKVAKRLITTARQTNMALFALEFNLFSKYDKKGAYSYYVWDFQPGGFVQDKELFTKAKGLYDTIQSETVNVEVVGGEVEGDIDSDNY